MRLALVFILMLSMAAPLAAQSNMQGYDKAPGWDAGSVFTKAWDGIKGVFKPKPETPPAIAVPPLSIEKLDAANIQPKTCMSDGVVFKHNDLRNLDMRKFPLSVGCVKDTPPSKCVGYRCLSGKWYSEEARIRAQQKNGGTPVPAPVAKTLQGAQKKPAETKKQQPK
jgi:hypothetical protein